MGAEGIVSHCHCFDDHVDRVRPGFLDLRCMLLPENRVDRLEKCLAERRIVLGSDAIAIMPPPEIPQAERHHLRATHGVHEKLKHVGEHLALALHVAVKEHFRPGSRTLTLRCASVQGTEYLLRSMLTRQVLDTVAMVST